MATPEAQESAAKARIIKHMNADHHDSVRETALARREGHISNLTTPDPPLCRSLRLQVNFAEPQCTDDRYRSGPDEVQLRWPTGRHSFGPAHEVSPGSARAPCAS